MAYGLLGGKFLERMVKAYIISLTLLSKEKQITRSFHANIINFTVSLPSYCVCVCVCVYVYTYMFYFSFTKWI